jgi:hypothetical protein
MEQGKKWAPSVRGRRLLGMSMLQIFRCYVALIRPSRRRLLPSSRSSEVHHQTVRQWRDRQKVPPLPRGLERSGRSRKTRAPRVGARGMHESAGRKAEHAGSVRVKFAEGEGRKAERRGRRESLGRGEGELSFQLRRSGFSLLGFADGLKIAVRTETALVGADPSSVAYCGGWT